MKIAAIIEPCPHCHGTGQEWKEFYGSRVITLVACGRCLGLGDVTRYISKEEAKAIVDGKE